MQPPSNAPFPPGFPPGAVPAPAQAPAPAPAPVHPQAPPPVPAHQHQAPAALPSLAGAQVGNQTGRPLPSGYEYVVEITKVDAKQTYYGLRFIVEFNVLESTNPNVRPGEPYSWAKPFQDQYGHGPNEIKGWLCQLIEHLVPDSSPGTQWDDRFLAWVVDATHQPAAGTKWHCRVWDKSKRNPTPGTSPVISIVDWLIWDGQSLQATAAPVAASVPAWMAPDRPAGLNTGEPPPVAQPSAQPVQAPPGYPPGLPLPPGIGR